MGRKEYHQGRNHHQVNNKGRRLVKRITNVEKQRRSATSKEQYAIAQTSSLERRQREKSI